MSWAKDAVRLSSFSGSNIACLTPANCFINVNNAYFDPNSVHKATLSNNFGGEVVAKYKLDPLTFYGGWIYARLMNPSDDYLTGFSTISQGIFIPPGFLNKGVYVNNAITVNAYDVNRIINTWPRALFPERRLISFRPPLISTGTTSAEPNHGPSHDPARSGLNMSVHNATCETAPIKNERVQPTARR